MLVDSHCHLDRIDLAPYGGDLQKALDAARDAGVSGFLSVCVDLETFPAVLKTAAHDGVWVSVGVHPLEKEAPEPELEQLVSLASHPKVVAIGETGLDYYYAGDRKVQMQERFVTHLQASAQTRLPLIVHTRDARDDTLALMRNHACQDSAGVLHCFTESWDMARAAMDMNYCISFSGIVTFRNAESLRDVVRKMPLDRMLIETDSPYLAPVPHRGRSNEPLFVADVARCVAELKGITVEELGRITTENYYRLFSKAAASE